jgi:hypothetical protein
MVKMVVGFICSFSSKESADACIENDNNGNVAIGRFFFNSDASMEIHPGVNILQLIQLLMLPVSF